MGKMGDGEEFLDVEFWVMGGEEMLNPMSYVLERSVLMSVLCLMSYFYLFLLYPCF
jgi:hypothetical protein